MPREPECLRELPVEFNVCMKFKTGDIKYKRKKGWICDYPKEWLLVSIVHRVRREWRVTEYLTGYAICGLLATPALAIHESRGMIERFIATHGGSPEDAAKMVIDKVSRDQAWEWGFESMWISHTRSSR